MVFILLERLAVLFMIAGLGFFAQRKRILTHSVQQAAREIMLKLSVPFSIIASANMQGETVAKTDIFIMIGISAIALFTWWLVAQLLLRIRPGSPSEKAGCILNMMFGNTLFIGLPLADAAFGARGVFLLAMFNILSAVLTWTYGVSVGSAQGGFSLKRLFLNPGALASLFTLLLVLLDLQLPSFALDFCQFLGAMAAPLSMLLLGSMLAGSSLGEVFRNPMAAVQSLARLIFVPLLLLFLLRLAGINSFLLQISAICIAIPAGALNPNIIKSGGLDPEPANAMVLQSTALSFLTLPAMMAYTTYLSSLSF